MSGSSPWSIKGVSREDREIAKQEARRSGEPIGVWLSRRIRAAAGNDERRAAPSGGGDPGPAGSPSSERPSSGDGPPPGDDRRQIVRGLGRRATDHPDFGFGPGRWRQARDTILAREDARFSESLAALRDRVHALENRVEAPSDSADDVEARVRGLSNRIAELAGRLELLESNRSTDMVERKVDRLEDDFIELDRFVRRIPTDMSETVDGLERRIEQLLDRMRVVEEFVLPGQRRPGFFGRLFGRKSR